MIKKILGFIVMMVVFGVAMVWAGVPVHEAIHGILNLVGGLILLLIFLGGFVLLLS